MIGEVVIMASSDGECIPGSSPAMSIVTPRRLMSFASVVFADCRGAGVGATAGLDSSFARRRHACIQSLVSSK